MGRLLCSKTIYFKILKSHSIMPVDAELLADIKKDFNTEVYKGKYGKIFRNVFLNSGQKYELDLSPAVMDAP